VKTYTPNIAKKYLISAIDVKKRLPETQKSPTLWDRTLVLEVKSTL